MEEYKGYKVPECTEEEVRKTAKNDCCELNIRYHNRRCDGLACRHCVLGHGQRVSGITQSYLDHRWPQKVAVRCETRKEWKRVNAKLDCVWEHIPSGFYSRDLCITLDSRLWNDKDVLEGCGYTIISAQEYLGEEKDMAFYANGTSHNDGNNSNTKEEDMSATAISIYIAEVYDKLEDAILVYTYMGAELEQCFGHKFTRKLWLETNKEAYLEEAKREEEEANKE